MSLFAYLVLPQAINIHYVNMYTDRSALLINRYMYTYIHFVYALYMPTCMYMYSYMYMHTYSYMYMHTYMHMYIQNMYACMYAQYCLNVCAHVHMSLGHLMGFYSCYYLMVCSHCITLKFASLKSNFIRCLSVAL